jgi:hypothetical protein
MRFPVLLSAFVFLILMACNGKPKPQVEEKSSAESNPQVDSTNQLTSAPEPAIAVYLLMDEKWLGEEPALEEIQNFYSNLSYRFYGFEDGSDLLRNSGGGPIGVQWNVENDLILLFEADSFLNLNLNGDALLLEAQIPNADFPKLKMIRLPVENWLPSLKPFGKEHLPDFIQSRQQFENWTESDADWTEAFLSEGEDMLPGELLEVEVHCPDLSYKLVLNFAYGE